MPLKRYERIIKMIKSGDTVLDVGGINHDHKEYKREDWLHKGIKKVAKQVDGIDIEREEIKHLNNLGYNVFYADIENPDVSLDKKYDVIVAGELIEHLSKPGIFLENCKKFLKEKGRLIITTPNAWCYFNFASILLRQRTAAHWQHTCWYDKQTIEQLFHRFDLKVAYFSYMPMEGPYRTLGYFLYLIGLKEFGCDGLFYVLKKNNG